jgi:hypothetical protein
MSINGSPPLRTQWSLPALSMIWVECSSISSNSSSDLKWIALSWFGVSESHAELEGKTPLRTDAYFRVYSMTKPVVSVALLMLFEEGKFKLTDPIEKYIQAMKDV